jgi:hypothetical protein
MSIQFRCTVTDIKWDTDGEVVDGLADQMVVTLALDDDIAFMSDADINDQLSDMISDQISDESGYCHTGFNMTYEQV